MTSIINPETDKILNTYHQYERLTMDKNVAAQLTVAHFMDHVICVIKESTQLPPKAIKKETAPKINKL